jgi:predicted membrane chloride channel (bestrophin family)
MKVATVKNLQILFNSKSIILCLFSIAATFLCLHFDITADLPLTLLGIAVVFPVVFSIGEAFKRRESALAFYGNIKAHSRSLFLGTRDWIEKDNTQELETVKNLLQETLQSCKNLLHSEKADFEQKQSVVYHNFSEISKFIKHLRTLDLPSGEASRANQYLSKMMEAFENMKHIYEYRTPVTLRMYNKLFIYSVPIVYAPYFAHIAKSMKFGLIFVTPILLTVMLVGLDNIQDQLENPFDDYGEDDVKIRPDELIKHLSD